MIGISTTPDRVRDDFIYNWIDSFFWYLEFTNDKSVLLEYLYLRESGMLGDFGSIASSGARVYFLLLLSVSIIAKRNFEELTVSPAIIT